MNQLDLWRRYQQYLCTCDGLGLRLDISRMTFDAAYLPSMARPIASALAAMEQLERGSKANIDEDRMVGHYWLRAPHLAPTPSIHADIEKMVAEIKEFARAVHDGTVRPRGVDGFYVVLVIGIGGSILGAQLLADSLGGSDDPTILRFIDNTDPDGIDRVLAELDETLDQTLVVIVSKSGETIETRNGMLEVASAYRRAGLHFADHAVAVTTPGSSLHQKAIAEKWLRVFPMWEWIGGRTSVLSAAGLLPAALQGIDVDALLSGAGDCDAATRNSMVARNPAALMALMWHHAIRAGKRNMVLLPYRDRLALLGRYLQQLVMESVGKRLDRDGNVVHKGLSVYGNKGSTDQHALVQQLQEGPNDFFATFVEVLHDRAGESVHVEDDVTSGDYLSGFLHGTRTALFENGRESITQTLDELSARTVGVLIALFERAVGLYAELINVNAYHQPGVELAKQAASRAMALQRAALLHLRGMRGQAATAEEIAAALNQPEAEETIHHLLEHAAANADHHVLREPCPDATASNTRYRIPT